MTKRSYLFSVLADLHPSAGEGQSLGRWEMASILPISQAGDGLWDGRWTQKRTSPRGRWEILQKLVCLPMGDGRSIQNHPIFLWEIGDSDPLSLPWYELPPRILGFVFKTYKIQPSIRKWISRSFSIIVMNFDTSTELLRSLSGSMSRKQLAHERKCFSRRTYSFLHLYQ